MFRRRRSLTHGVIGSAEQRAVAGDGHARDGHVLLRDQLVGAIVLRQVPNADAAHAVTGDDFALVRVDDDVVGGAAVIVAALNLTGSGLPNLHGSILGARDHPLALTVECDAGDVAGVALEGQQWVWVGGLDIKELHGVVAGRGKVALVGGDAEAVDLRVWVLDGARADAGERFPESEEEGLASVNAVASAIPDSVPSQETYLIVWSYPAVKNMSASK